MRKILLILSLIFTLGLVGCSSQNGYKDVSVSRIKKSIESSDLLVQTTTSLDIIDSDYFNDVDDKISEGFIIKSTINTQLEDIIVIKAEEAEKNKKTKENKKTEDTDYIYQALTDYKDNIIIDIFGDGYGSKNNANISSNTILSKKGNYYYLISAKNAKEIEKVILDRIKK